MNEPTGRYDPVEQHYLHVESFEGQVNWMSWIAVAAFAAYVVLHMVHSPWDSLAKLGFVLLTCLSIVWGYWTRFSLQPVADRLRRRLLISDATGISIASVEQSHYWNNPEVPSLRRVLMNLAENTFFVPRLLRHDIGKQIVQVLVVSLALFIGLRYGTVEVVELFAVLVLFSELLLGKLVRTTWALVRMRQLHLEIVATLRLDDPQPLWLAAMALYLLGEYEYVKSRASYRAPMRTFQRLNPSLTAQWEDYRRTILEAGRS